MSEVTMQAIEELLEDMFDKKLEPIKKTLAEHSVSLAELMADRKSKADSKTVDEHRVKRLEEWAQKAGEKIGLRIDW